MPTIHTYFMILYWSVLCYFKCTTPRMHSNCCRFRWQQNAAWLHRNSIWHCHECVRNGSIRSGSHTHPYFSDFSYHWHYHNKRKTAHVHRHTSIRMDGCLMAGNISKSSLIQFAINHNMICLQHKHTRTHRVIYISICCWKIMLKNWAIQKMRHKNNTIGKMVGFLKREKEAELWPHSTVKKDHLNGHNGSYFRHWHKEGI